MAPKHGLGKGLDALLPMDDESFTSDMPSGFSIEADADGTEAAGSGQSGRGEVFLPLDKLSANPNQPRKNFDEAALQELADSIREHGIIQPILAEDAGDGTYIIIAGERRCRAARIAGLAEVPALIRSYSDEKRMEISLVENIQRSDLNPVEEALAYRQLMELTGLSQDDVAVRVGKNRSTVTNTLRLLKLPQPMLKALQEGGISPGHGRALLSVNESAGQEGLFQEILAKSLSVREAERRAAEINAAEHPAEPPAEGPAAAPAKAPEAPRRDPELISIEQKFIDTLGTKVSIDGDLEKGKIRIEYYSMDDLDRLLQLLGG
jgi:ParB family chromosome partitioning protein